MGNPVTELLNDVRAQGFEVREGRHFKVYNDLGEMVSVPRTPGDVRSLKNVLKYLKRIGYQPKGR